MKEEYLDDKEGIRKFYKHVWIHNRTITEWLRYFNNEPQYTLYVKYVRKTFLFAKGLYLEGLISKEEHDRLLSMLKSADDENVLLALTIMSNLKSGKFKKE